MPETDDVIEITDAPTETHPENAPVADGLPVEVEFAHEEIEPEGEILDLAFTPFIAPDKVEEEIESFVETSTKTPLTLLLDNGTVRKATFVENEAYLNFLYINNQVEYTKIMATGSYSASPVSYPFATPEVQV